MNLARSVLETRHGSKTSSTHSLVLPDPTNILGEGKPSLNRANEVRREARTCSAQLIGFPNHDIRHGTGVLSVYKDRYLAFILASSLAEQQFLSAKLARLEYSSIFCLGSCLFGAKDRFRWA